VQKVWNGQCQVRHRSIHLKSLRFSKADDEAGSGPPSNDIYGYPKQKK
jgi:hypothetical protein